jgi:DNA-damage-inducible protein D
MVKDLTPYNGDGDSGSPFDAIRETRSDGSEFWSARRLMPLLGYRSWQNFQLAITRAKTLAGGAGYVVKEHFNDVINLAAQGGNPTANVELTRRAAYYVAVCSDDRKPEVQAAKIYFVHRAREAEVAGSMLQVPTNDFDLMRQQLKMMATFVDRFEAQERAIAEATSIAVESSVTSQEALTKAEEAVAAARITAEQMNAAAQELANITARKFASTRKLEVNNEFIRRLGKEATRLCIDRGIERTEVPHAQYGSVGTYPEEILDEAYQNLITEMDAGLW